MQQKVLHLGNGYAILMLHQRNGAPNTGKKKQRYCDWHSQTTVSSVCGISYQYAMPTPYGYFNILIEKIQSLYIVARIATWHKKSLPVIQN